MSIPPGFSYSFPAELLSAFRSQCSHVPVPTDVNTDLNLLRWINGHANNVLAAATAFLDYVERRRAAGLENMTGEWFLQKRVQRYFRFWSISALNANFDEQRNMLVCLEQGIKQPHDVSFRNLLGAPLNFCQF
jgi:hypothetical protein